MLYEVVSPVYERLFGVRAWEFRFSVGVTPLSEAHTVALAIACYLLVVFGLQVGGEKNDACSLLSLVCSHGCVLASLFS